MNINKKLTGAVIIGVVVLVLGYFAVQKFTFQNQDEPATVPKEDTKSDDSNSNTASSTDDNSKLKIIIEPVKNTSMPNLDRPIVIKGTASAEQKQKTEEAIRKIIESLRKDSKSYNNWQMLGLYRKEIEDYEGASEVWEYMITVWSKDSVTFGNLGVLYGSYLKDPQKSEKYFLQAISLDPTSFNLYEQLYEMYRYLLKDKAKAIEILQKAKIAIPGDAATIQKIIDDYEKSTR